MHAASMLPTYFVWVAFVQVCYNTTSLQLVCYVGQPIFNKLARSNLTNDEIIKKNVA